MTKSNRNLAHRLLVLFASLALFATACGGGPSSAESSAAAAAAEVNEPALNLTGDFSSSQLLTVATGDITELSEVVTGDRPVLLWYWAPH